METLDLHAARLSKPPEVSKAKHLSKDKIQKKVTKPIQKQKKQIIVPDSPMVPENHEPMAIDQSSQPSMLVQPFTPILPHQNIKKNSKPTNRNIVPITSRISYDVKEILERKADINVKDLLTVAPSMKRELFKAIKSNQTNNKENGSLSLNFFEDDDVDTTAIYTDFYINDVRVRSMLDTGSAKTCMSKDVADKLQLVIDSPSTSIFTLGNGTKQASLGIVYDVPLNLGGNIIIPGSIEILPVCPANLIIGNNWMKRAKAKLNLEEKMIRVEYKTLKAKNPFTYTKASHNPHVSSSNIHYTIEGGSQTNAILPMIKTVALDESDGEPSSEDELHDGDTDEDDINEDLEPESSGSDGEMLLMLEDEYKEHSDPDRFGRLGLQKVPYEPSNFDVFVYDNHFYIPPHSYREYHLGLNHLLDQKKLKEDPRFQVVCDIVCDKLCNKECVWAQSASYIVQKEDTVYLFLVNDSDNAIILEPGELIANMDVIYMSEIEEFKAFKLGKLNEEMLSNELFSCEVQDDTDLDKYEDKIKDKIDISNVPSDIKKDFLSLISQFDHIFDWNNDKIGNINVGEHVIQLKPDAVPRRVKPYRLSRHETECLREELDKLLKLGIIERAGYSEWASPLIMLKKKDGSYRIVADFRYLNSQSQTMNYPLTNIDDLLDRLNEAYWMSCFDLRSGFFQANIASQSRPLTTVVCSLGAFYFKKLAQGISSSPSAFSEMMQKCFHSLVNECLILYLDDVTTYTNQEDPRQHLQDLAKTFNCMSKHGIVLNPKKCHFFKEEILFLGYVVTRHAIKPNPATIEKVKDFPLPTTIKQVRSFLGLASYYRRFVNGFAKIARPLHDQLKTTKRLAWTDEATKAFHTLKEKLTSESILRKPDFNKPFEVVCDASIQGLGAILTQRTEEGHEYPVVFSSRSLHGSERNYGISKLELLAVVWSLKLYRPYLLGSPFQVTVISDHSALPGLLKTKQPTGILARWIETLSEFDFKIIYRKGRVNEAADFLSRLGY